jgi:hypothetical protein
MLIIQDPNSDTKTDVEQAIEDFFLIIYTIEMFLKMFALGVIFEKKSYLRDYWNLMDFGIIISAYLPYVFGTKNGVNLKGLRTLRVLRPLRTISSIKALK